MGLIGLIRTVPHHQLLPSWQAQRQLQLQLLVSHRHRCCPHQSPAFRINSLSENRISREAGHA